MIGRCDVCLQVKEVEPCGTCKALLCAECRPNPVTRTVAAVRRLNLGRFMSR